MRKLLLAACLLISFTFSALAAEPVVAIHVSELTQALETMPASGATPTGAGYTGHQWWTPYWHYFVMPESLKEALRSDGTPFVVVSDADIRAGSLLNPDGSPKYPIVISLASEAVSDDEVTPLENYVSAGGFLFVGSSSFTRNPDGTTRGDFALADAMGLHMMNASLQNWDQSWDFYKMIDHRLVSHIPDGQLIWRMPLTSEDVSWGKTPDHEIELYHNMWMTNADGATVIALGSGNPYLATKSYGKGYFIYHAAMQPLIGHGGWAPGMYAYGIFRNAIEWAFETANLPLIKVSPWPYPYNSAYAVRHDFENSQSLISSIESSAQFDSSVGARGDYYFCTGVLRVEMENSPDTIASLRRAVSLSGATIGSHNGGLSNPGNPDLTVSDGDYWHWGPDEILDILPPGYPSGGAYASASIAASFADLDGWLSGLSTNTRNWVSPWFNSTREGSYQILEQLGVATAGEQKLSPFPHWTVSTETQGKRFSFVTLPVSDWYINGDIAQAINPYHTPPTIQGLVDYYYGLGALINLYMHEPSTNPNPAAYIQYAAAKPAIWPVNATTVLGWWTKRSPVQVTPSCLITDHHLVATASITGATDADTAIELVIPNWTVVSSDVEVKLNGVVADPGSYRTYHQGIKVQVGTTVSSVEVSYPLTLVAKNDAYSVMQGGTLEVAAPAVLGNDTGDGLTAALVNSPTHGTFSLQSDGSFSYAPFASFSGTDSFTYQASAGGVLSNVATVTLTVTSLTPVAQNDAYSVAQGGTLDVTVPGVLGNDTGAGLTATLVSPPAQGTFSLQSDGSFSYAPFASFSGADSFTYQASAGGELSNTATVTITVTPLAPVAQNDAYSVAQGGTLNVPAPGVLGNDTGAGLTATLVSSTAQGTLSLQSDGSFSYAPFVSFSGTDNFTYQASAGGVLSNVATVTLTVTSVTLDSVTLNPGAVTGGSGSQGTVTLTGPALSGGAVVTLQSSNPAVAQVPASVTVEGGATSATFGVSTSAVSGMTPLAVTASYVGTNRSGALTLWPAGSVLLLSDAFSGPGGSDPLWTTVQGTWNVAGGTMTGTSPVNNDGYAYAAGNWSDYTVEGRLQLPAGAFGGGLGGRVDAVTGARYGVWVYPEGSVGGSSVVKLIKFWSWGTWGFTPMAEASLPGVGTRWHTLTVTFQGNRIVVYYDGVQVLDTTDNGFDSRPAYTSGGVSLEMSSWAMSTPNVLSVDDVWVLAPPVTLAATNTALTSSLNPSNVGQAVTFTAVVTSGAGTPTGTVTFNEGATALGTGTLSAGTASLMTVSLSAGTHSITAVYNGDASFAGSTSAVLSQGVNKNGTGTVV
ncbi:MAG: tandem-95 repeat protein, partial [Acidobacteriia bacterium]|nr:tandem-95 repeat protein [Terriglobia bacterium]